MGPGKAFELNVDKCTPVWCCAAYFVAAIFIFIVSKLLLNIFYNKHSGLKRRLVQTSLKA